MGMLAFSGIASADSAAIRLVDLTQPPAFRAATVDGTRKRVFDPYKKEQVFKLGEVPAAPVLSFSIGRARFEGTSSIRFEIWLRRAEHVPVQLYGRELDHSGWIDERIDLSNRPLDGAELVFVRSAVEASPSQLFSSLWGDPMLLPGSGVRGPSVILISLDTLRADRLGVYGNRNAHTPTLDALAQAGVWYSQAASPSTWTYPSHASLFFGLRAAVDPCPDPNGIQPKSRACPDQYQPLAEILRQAGDVTAAFTGGGYLSYSFGFARGFDTYYMFPQPQLQLGECRPERLDGREVFARATRWLRERGRAPFFLFVHTYDVHDRCPFRTDPNNAEQWSFAGADGRARFLAYYDQLISDTDAKVGALLHVLDDIGAADSTLVVVTSDHGEGLGEHDFNGHGCPYKPYQELVHVPLIMRWPKRLPAGERIDAPVSLIDVTPSVLALTGTTTHAPMDGVVLPGLNLPGTLRQAQGERDRSATYMQCGDLLAVRRGKDKLVTSRAGAFADELYDLAVDPLEKATRTAESDIRAQLKQDAAAYWAKVPAESAGVGESREIDADTKERLRALGYQ